MNNKNTFSGIVDKVDKDFIDSFKTVKDCKTCIHNRVCLHKSKNEEYKKQMKMLIEEWGADNTFGFTMDCPEWHEQPMSINFENGSEIKIIPPNGLIRGKRSDLLIHYHDYEKLEDKVELFEMLIKALIE